MINPKQRQIMNSLNSEEQQKILKWNDTSCAYEENTCIHEKLEEQSEKTPNNIALSFREKDLSYQELNDATNAFANVLLGKNINLEDNVIVHLGKCIELIIGIFGVLKAGGVYIPISPNYPKERVKHILNDSRSKFIVTSKQFANCYNSDECEIIIVDDFVGLYRSLNIDKPKVNVTSKNLAYIIYTSGTTGKPKGVLIEHHSVLNRIGWMQKQFPLDENDVLLQKTPITFDVSIWELFWWAFTGSKLVILPEGDEKRPNQIIKYIKDYNISIIHFVPSMFNVFAEIVGKMNSGNQINSLRWIFCSGEELKHNSVFSFYQTIGKNQIKTIIINLYGPTEATIDVTYHRCKQNEEFRNIPIGKPIDNTEIYIIDNSNNILPNGEEGELVICGVSLARGYLNQQKLTDEKFINLNVFGQIKKAYKTGDRAYYDDDGEIIFKGRIDNQIKLRGNRIELGEIENTILQFKDIESCVCLLKDVQETSAHIIAFITPRSNEEINISDLNDYIKKWLPVYMIPTKIISVKEFPLTVHGKLDRAKLLQKCEFDDKQFIVPESQIEKTIQSIWTKLFNKKYIPSDANFFDIGGNSIFLIQLVYAINDSFNIELEIISVFEFPTINLLSKHINELLTEKKQLI